MTTKQAGANYPRCSKRTAEFKREDESFRRWKCSDCSAQGKLTQSAPPAADGGKPLPHWSTRKVA